MLVRKVAQYFCDHGVVNPVSQSIECIVLLCQIVISDYFMELRHCENTWLAKLNDFVWFHLICNYSDKSLCLNLLSFRLPLPTSSKSTAQDTAKVMPPKKSTTFASRYSIKLKVLSRWSIQAMTLLTLLTTMCSRIGHPKSTKSCSELGASKKSCLLENNSKTSTLMNFPTQSTGSKKVQSPLLKTRLAVARAGHSVQQVP